MNSITPAHDPVSEPIATLLEVFGAQAEALCFPDVDHSALQQLAAELRQAAAEAERAEEALALAREEVEARRAALLSRATRGLAYAKVYAQDDPALLQRLEALELTPRRAGRGAPRRAPAKRGRGRARRTRAPEADDTVTELFGAQADEPDASPPTADAR